MAWLPTLLGPRAGDVVVLPASPTPPTTSAPAGRRHARWPPTAWPSWTPQTRATRASWSGSTRPATPPAGPRRRRTCAQWWSPGPAQLGAVVACDECYAELGWGELGRRARRRPCPASSTRGSRGARTRACWPSTRSQAVQPRRLPRGLRGRRPGAGAATCSTVRKHAGMIVPCPVQEAHARGAGRRRPRRGAEGAVPAAGASGCCRRWRVRPARSTTPRPASTCGRTAGEDAWTTVGRLCRRGHRGRPGHVLRRRPARHVRVALTATDERIAAAVDRLS